MISLLSRPLHLISIDNNFTVTLYFYSDLKSCLPYQIRMGRGLHWDPFAHWWGHKNGHNLSQKKRHSNRFLKKISKGDFFCKVIRHRKMKSWVYYVPLICASEQKSYHTRYEYSKFFSTPIIEHFLLCNRYGFILSFVRK